MADPFSITVGAVGTAGVALQAVTALLNDFQAFRNAPALIMSLEQQIVDMQAVLQLLDLEDESSKLRTLSPNAQSALWSATEHCAQACERFHAKIKKWTAHSTDGKMRLWDRARFGLFAEADVDMLCEQLRTCKNTVTTAVATATLYTTPICFCWIPKANLLQVFLKLGHPKPQTK